MEIFVGTFNELDLKQGKDKEEIERVKEETNLPYIKSKVCTENSIRVMKVWLTNKF